MRLAVLVVLAAVIGCAGGTAPARGDAVAPSPAPTCEVPTQLGVVFVVDDSGSMTWNDPQDLRSASLDVGVDQMRNGSVYAASSFSSGVEDVASPTVVGTGTRPRLHAQVDGRMREFGGTDYEAAFREAARQLGAMPATVDQKAVVFLSDGEPNDPGYTSDRPIAAAGIPIFTIGFGGASTAELDAIAQRSGGSRWTVMDVASIQHTVATIVASLECDRHLGSVGPMDIDRGGKAGLDFDISSCDSIAHVLVAWGGGTAPAVNVQRPDGSVVNLTHLPGAGLRAGDVSGGDTTFRSLAVDPALAGAWHVHVVPLGPVTGVTVDAWSGHRSGECTVTPVNPTPPASPPTGPPPPVPGRCWGVGYQHRDGTASIDLTWTVGLTGAAPAADVEYSAVQPLAWLHQSVAAPATSTRIDGVRPNTIYTIHIRAVAADGATSDACILQVLTGWATFLRGTVRAERIAGTNGNDYIDAGAGNDLVQGMRGDDEIHGGDGNDSLTGDWGDDVLFGEGGADKVYGSLDDDELHGGDGPDLLDGGAGSDALYGDDGIDRLIGGPGRDTLDGGPGADIITAYDREADSVTCGDGKDTVTADLLDKVASDCERVTRRR